MFVYADNAATTRIAPQVLDAMLPYLKEEYGNPSTLYKLGREAKIAIEKAREQVAQVIGAKAEEIFFTGSGTEADNMALKGVLYGPAGKGKKHLITTKIEHHAILHTAMALEKEGFQVTFLDVDKNGRVDLEELKQAITPDTALVSIMAANNEVGTIQPIEEIGKICREKGVLFHTDAVQAFGHMPLDVNKMNIDLLSLSAHKINGPKGSGALYIRRGLGLRPVIEGGGQERNRRSGTENVAGIVGLGQAAQLAMETMVEESARLKALAKKLTDGVLQIPETILTGDPENRLPGACSFAISAIEGESLVLYLDMEGICTSTGSACSTGSLDPSHVLMAIGLSHEVSHGSLRVTLGRFNTEEEVNYIIETLPKVVEKLRSMSPVWNRK
ncbi:cysteine desulfurase NifS [Intestinimonas sp. MSJ-38]|uniref:cysteine desulfurase NifS n=1 Tax=Intestinimonas sp. MSJ-38 TaxID=2841532 RepID=UPI001C0FE065|nr:cysteine desulfurase NifS [Intestinimonas sp. MSJ-38]MBU5431366.1 cysteine desulfurase NifS [Intestinimonas sp. MSJ-38]